MDRLSLFGHVAAAFAEAPPEGIATAHLYEAVATADCGAMWVVVCSISMRSQ